MTQDDRKAAIIDHAIELANSGDYSGWLYIQRAMFETNRLSRDDNPLDDSLIRHDLDARCLAARRRVPAAR